MTRPTDKELLHEAIDRGEPVAYNLHIVDGVIRVPDGSGAVIIGNVIESRSHGHRLKARKAARSIRKVAVVLPFVGLAALLVFTREFGVES